MYNPNIRNYVLKILSENNGYSAEIQHFEILQLKYYTLKKHLFYE